MEFRQRETTPEIEQPIIKSEDTTNHGNVDKSLTTEPEFNPQSELDKWEIRNGKYGEEYLQIKELVKEPMIKMGFGMIDKYIKGEMEMRGYDKTPKVWQDILGEIESQIGSSKLNAIDRVRKITGYIKVVQNFNKAKQNKELYTLGIRM